MYPFTSTVVITGAIFCAGGGASWAAAEKERDRQAVSAIAKYKDVGSSRPKSAGVDLAGTCTSSSIYWKQGNSLQIDPVVESFQRRHYPDLVRGYDLSPVMRSTPVSTFI